MPKHSEFCDLLDSHIRRLNAIDGTTEADIGKLIGKGQTAISDYRTGACRPPLSLIVDFANALRLHGIDRERFIEEAYLAHAPDRVRAIVADLRAKLIKLTKACRKAGIELPGDLQGL